MRGKYSRLNKIFDPKSKNTIIVPMDHGITLGPIKGLENLDNNVHRLAQNGVNAVLMHKGMINSCTDYNAYRNVAMVMHLSGSTMYTPNSGLKSITGSVYEAIALGCDAVSVHINIGDADEGKMFNDVANISSECLKYGIPLIAMVYARGKNVINEYAVDVVKHSARVGAELGADIVKVNYTGSIESFQSVVEACPIPVVIAGGNKVDSEEMFLNNIYDAMKAGARGVSIGRNVFQSDNMDYLTKAISDIVHGNKRIEAVIEEFKFNVNNKFSVV
ncbi:2-amino-3,7-dideoxy-D-threo-hept-6-ulosonate synthase [Clostridium cavendishii DSM 21758]|uniref:2-amino-3,7-dideoxy-D-threo-hept-6-ulosonate synthase n=1 Tax=Clostridium cavendishii DSM 21758 TaxID=1121302 RepID=A0A1M6IZT7_9CLOT|nr:2-amino-3,7-dideoxy-D-threo-hept-6-ulosonate synthase [Clostridium cavendishii]SHJ39949.1 2-amino-3,7-dideoxy-D-threo-hept-6-ulosonate synthase [Clostridium cavendishii DSM 21758]